MSSTNKYSSGLNNWLDSDRPERLDFVTDNEIIDQNALWRDDYDSEGIVAHSGGIEAYAMAKDIYDPAGSVAAAGGIDSAIKSAVSANEGYSTYVHNKIGNVHSLSNPSGENGIRFIATGNFNDGDTFDINGTACTAQTTSGEALDSGYFVSNAVVTCFRNGNTINFNKGGAGLNYKVIAAASISNLPSVAKENTTAVITTEPITGWTFSAVAPALAQTGNVWFKTGNSSTAPIYLIDKNKVIVYGQRGYQYIADSWIDKDVYVRAGTDWTPWEEYLFKNGTHPAVEWIPSYNNTSDTYISNVMHIDRNLGGYFTPIDLTNIDLIYANISTFYKGGNSTQNTKARLFASKTPRNVQGTLSWNSTFDSLNERTTTGLMSIGVGALKGIYYVGVSVTHTTSSTQDYVEFNHIYLGRS